MRGDITICNDEQFGQIASLEDFDFGSTMIYDNGLTAVKPCPMLNRTFSMLDSGDSFASGFLYIENEADGFKTLGCNFPASPNWGTTLACALSQVDRTSATGWFDVRVSLKSAAGSSVNLVSPAFRISEFAGIERISDDTATTDAPAEYFTIDGRRVSAPEPGSIVLCRRAGAVTKLIAR